MEFNEDRPISAPLKVNHRSFVRIPGNSKTTVPLKHSQLNQSFKQLQLAYDLSKEKIRIPVKKKISQNIKLNRTQLDLRNQIVPDKPKGRKQTESLNATRKMQEKNPRSSLENLKQNNLSNLSMDENRKNHSQKKILDARKIEEELATKIRKIKQGSLKYQLPLSTKNSVKKNITASKGSNKKLDIIREAFEQIIDKSGNFKTMLIKIKNAYEDVIQNNYPLQLKTSQTIPLQISNESRYNLSENEVIEKEYFKENQFSQMTAEQKIEKLMQENWELKKKLNESNKLVNELRRVIQEQNLSPKVKNTINQQEIQKNEFKQPSSQVKIIKKMQADKMRKNQASAQLKGTQEKIELNEQAFKKDLKPRIQSSNTISFAIIEKQGSQDSMNNGNESQFKQPIIAQNDMYYDQEQIASESTMNMKSALNMSIPKLDLSNIEMLSNKQIQQQNRETKDPPQNQDQSNKSTQSSTSKFQLKLNQNQPNFHEEFMARYDEFSESWRNAIIRNGR